MRTSPERLLWALLLALLLTWRAGSTRAEAPQSPDGFAGWPRTAVEIRTRAGRQWFNVTVADTEARREQGLMFVRALAADESMWFPQRPPRVMSMWMKNTVIPLDMLFVDRRGRIACISARASPESLALISCKTPVSGVLEIGGGEAERRGIRPGDTVTIAGSPP
jgi:uncharacterized membrane protein (UPF0127 family)